MSKYNGLEIAVVGLSGQFPGANNVDKFWTNLQQEIESVSFFNNQELIEEGASEAYINNPLYVKANAYLDNKEYFDADFFGYLPAEARLMDPQLRLFHEHCWKALDDAGYGRRANSDKIGLFAGGTTNQNWVNYSMLSNTENLVDDYTSSQLRDITFLCSRVSYLLNLQGPSVYINTACSTSLVAIQRAVTSLLFRECNMALAGGVCINNYSKRGYLYQEGMISSPDGYCRAFDAEANGTVGGEGVGVVVLKRLNDALKDGDNVYAIIKGCAVNNDGNQKMSFTSPSIDGQYKVILKAMGMAKIEPDSISYVEAHGTGTKLGDPIEIEALNLAFGKSDKKYCALGSVKTNIGHLDAAAGVAGFIKTVLALKHRQLPASLHFRHPNPEINFAESPFYVNTSLKEWKNDHYPLRAGVSSFGIGGTNAHVILEEAPALEAGSESRSSQLLVISGKSAAALQRNVENLRHYLLTAPETIALSDIAYTLQTGRNAFGYRRMVVCQTKAEGAELLSEEVSRVIQLPEKEKPQVVFMFPGQGSQYWQMCYDLYEQEATFREEADNCFGIISRLSGKDLRSVIFGEHAAGDSGKIDQTAYTQPALFVIEYALSQQLMSWGIRPDLLTGHSIGEYVAGCLSGIFTLEDALYLVLKRGELMQQCEAGSMLSISIAEEELTRYLNGRPDLSLAAVNSPSQCVVSGTSSAITSFAAEMSEAGNVSKDLRTSHAFHSYMMDDVREAFKEELKRVKLRAGSLPLLSNVTGKILNDSEALSIDYWADQLRHPVRFSEGVKTLLEGKGEVVFVEVGPGKTLSRLVSSHPDRHSGHKIVSMVKHPLEKGDDMHYLLTALGELWARGISPDWEAFYRKESRRRVSLPAYSFEKIKYPVNVDAFKLVADMVAESSLNKKQDISQWFYTPSWKKMALRVESISGNKERCNLIFVDNSGAGDAIGERFRQASEEIIVIQKGKSFEKKSEKQYDINPLAENEYTQLLQDLAHNNIFPDRIIHCWAITGKVAEEHNEAFFSLLNISKAIRQAELFSLKEIVLITDDLYSISGEERIQPTASICGGLLNVLSQELITISSNHIDISLRYISNDDYCDRLIDEIREAGTGKVVALRNRQRWIQIFDRVDYHVSEPVRNFKAEGVYLITGGLGKLGYTLAKYLLESYQAKVILLGRTKLPLKEERAFFLEQESIDKEGAEKIRRLQHLEEIGGNVLYLNCNISVEEEFEKAVSTAEMQFGVINGVFHAAGITSANAQNSIDAFHLLTKKDFQHHFEPKIDGIKVIKNLLALHKLDFCLVASSLASILGGFGFAAYSAANAFLDFFISAQRCEGGLENWVSVNLDGLNFNKESLENSLNSEEICEVFERALLNLHLPQLVVSKQDLHKRLRNWINKEQIVFNTTEQDPDAMNTLSLQDVRNTEQELMQLWEQFFGKSGLNVNDDFFDLGGDSLKALTMVGRIHKIFNIEITLKEFFNRSSIRKLNDYIGLKIAGKDTSTGYSLISKAETKEYYSLSSAQKRLYFLYEFDKNSVAYNLPQLLKLTGEVDVQRLNKAFENLVQRHEILRTSFLFLGSQPVQTIAEEVDFAIEYQNLENRDLNAITQFVRPFDLSKGPLIRVGLMRLSDREHILIVDMHHIITDGVSLGVLTKEFMALYNGTVLPQLKLHYRDYANWQQSEAQRMEIAKQRDFWLKEFAEEVAVLDLPADHPRPLVKNYEGDSILFELSIEESNKLKLISKSEGVTLYMVLLASYNVLLARMANQEDITIGTPTAGRQHPDLETMIGMFVNTIPLRNYPKGNLSFREFLSEVKISTLNAFDNQHYQYEELIDELKVERNTGRNPLFDHVFVFQNYEDSELEIPGLVLSPVSYENRRSKFDLTLFAFEAHDQIILNFEYASSIFKRDTIEKLVRYFKNILTSISDNMDLRIAEIDLLSSLEKATLIQRFNDNKFNFPGEETLCELFEKQANKTPHHIALTFENQSITYEQLNNKVNTLACHLIQSGLEQQGVVGIMIERSIEMIVSILAVLRAGGIYLPLESHSESRIKYILNETNARFLLTEGVNKTVYGSHIQIIDAHDVETQRNTDWDIINTRSAENVAYIIYTSGSTGRPKGVMITHRSVTNLIYSQQQTFGINENEKILQFSTVCFDASVEQIWLALLSGATLVLVSKEIIRDNSRFIHYISKQKITHLHATPSFLETIELEKLTSLRRIIAGGEELKPQIASAIIKKGYKLYNEYGPTETTVTSLECEVTPEMTKSLRVPIGKPIGNTEVFILGRNLEILPVGCVGELYIGGKGVAKGYVNDEALTHQKFITSPFVADQRLYRTGDLAKWLPDGNIEFSGRQDDQVKIRGFRIELIEIEKQLTLHHTIEAAAVLARGKDSDKYIVAYCISNDEINSSLLKEHLLISLPEYMIPSYFIRVESFPLTVTGKLNRKALPLPDFSADQSFKAPSDSIEKDLVEIWASVLELDAEKISIYSNFFDIGGHSLKIIRMNKMVNSHFKVDISVGNIFRLSNIHAIADYIRNGDIKLKELEKGLDERDSALDLLSEHIN